MRFLQILICVGVTILRASTTAAQHSQMPAGMTHEEHLTQMQKDADLKKRGAQTMGFDQERTTHHFRLSRSGGLIEISVNDASDTASRDQVRQHLREIAGEFANRVFDKPSATHAEVPPGVADMQRLNGTIGYTFEDTPTGARVRIHTTDAKALGAVHEFLRYQIREHGTDDPMSVATCERVPGERR
jgi:hypothetical protein